MDKALGTWCSHLNGLRCLLNDLFPVVENTHERVRLKVNGSQESFRIMLRGNHAKCLDNLDIWLIVNMIEVGVWSVVWQNEPSSEVSGVSTTTDTQCEAERRSKRCDHLFTGVRKGWSHLEMHHLEVHHLLSAGVFSSRVCERKLDSDSVFGWSPGGDVEHIMDQRKDYFLVI